MKNMKIMMDDEYSWTPCKGVSLRVAQAVYDAACVDTGGYLFDGGCLNAAALWAQDAEDLGLAWALVNGRILVEGQDVQEASRWLTKVA